MKAEEYKKTMKELYYKFCALCDDVSPTNGYRYDDDRVVKFYNKISNDVDAIQKIIDSINPIYNYSVADHVIEKFTTRLKSFSIQWFTLKVYSNKVLPR